MRYDSIAILQNIHLEDSYVINIKESEKSIEFEMELVVLDEHPEYVPPNHGEQYCYANGILSLTDIRNLRWLNRCSMINTDKNGEEDMGNIDSFVIEMPKIQLTGDWGEVEFECQPENITLKTL